jgi:hypothetical protein
MEAAVGWYTCLGAETINHDHMNLIHMFNVARSPQFRLVTENQAAHVPKPNPQNERDRIATLEEWARLERVFAPHLRQRSPMMWGHEKDSC